MTSIPDSARAVLESPALAHLVTLNPDGSPQVRNIRNDSRVALSAETENLNAMGLTEYLVIYGTARITEGGAAELPQELALLP